MPIGAETSSIATIRSVQKAALPVGGGPASLG
jgi:hypothetical protein